MDELGSRESDDAERWSRLTDKQRACLDLLVERKTSKQIARDLGIAKVTVDQRIRAARNILSASDRDETAIIYTRLKPIYDRVIYDPVDLPQPQNSVPSIDTNGSAFKAIALSEHMTSVVEPPRRPSPFKDLWRHDHATKSRLLITVTIAVSAAIIALVGLAIALVLTQLISV
ncbi:LuxR C-terminal-related transcriptional regulator [Sphingopyxis sp. GW247-27LB]|uniref:sigma factor-like helix-turn-helix DNA-binding protein n=1 Tax=Sphingopyxis sp. GW247-27LB TaxID=2012632 RepID=UPI000BA527BE|nr:LuxR C-terminal-related transcriptional regulator [Sphingopyxis sp. GW247-27LB]PAL24276.1 helix-turn-helix transcriptional regulator [Sphingopyxis sp. GW247-27LB]